MEARNIEYEGTWEEVIRHAEELAGRRVRVTVLEDPLQEKPVAYGTPANSLLKYAGTWAGDDLEERLQEVHENRTEARF